MNLFNNPIVLLRAFVFAAFFLLASSSGAEEGSKDGLHARLETFTVNLLGPAQQFLQLDITLSLAKAEAGEKIKTYMPVIRHNMILLLTSKTASRLETNAGKLELKQQAKNAVNNALELTEKEGVSDVLLDSFIIQ